MTPQELKNSILQLAIQGKLVEQRPEEGTAAELYKQIQAEKQALIKAGKIKKEKPLPVIPEDEVPFEIPESWMWVRLVELGSFSSGKTPTMGEAKYWNNGTVEWFTSKDMKRKYLDESEMKITELAAEEMTKYPAGTLLMVVRSGILKRMLPLCILTQESTINQDIKAYRLFDSSISEYVYYMLKGLETHILENYRKQVTTVDSLKFDEFSKEMLVPLPPLAEQKRIVTKIEELLPLIERYEKAWSRLEDFNKRFPGDMQKSILQMAIQGKLVEQRPEEGTGEELYKQIQAEKQALIKAGKIKKEKPLPEISEDEIPFEIPESWKWARLGDLSWFFDAGKSPNCLKQPVHGAEWGVITTTSIQVGYFDEVQNKVLPETFVVNKSMKVNSGDILITRAGPTNRTGIACLVKSIQYNLILSDKTLRINMTDNYIFKDYIVMVLNSPGIRQLIIGLMSGMDRQQVNISQEKYKTVLIPLPPIAEQKRIVARLEELLPLCERLK